MTWWPRLKQFCSVTLPRGPGAMLDFDDLDEAEEKQKDDAEADAAREEEARQEAAKQEAARQEAARLEAAKQAAAKEAEAAQDAAHAAAQDEQRKLSAEAKAAVPAERVTLFEPMSAEAWAKHPRAGPGERPANMGAFKKVVNEVAPGEFWGLDFPFSPKMLKEMGPKWLTQAMRKAGTLPADNEVTAFSGFDVKAEDVTQITCVEDSNWGGAGLKILLTVEYKREPGPGEPAREMFVKMPHEFTGKNERYRNSVTATGDWNETMFYNLLSGRLSFRTPRGYFCDMNRRTTNFVVITERIPYGNSWERKYKDGEILPPPGKYRDWSIRNAADLYYAHTRTMAQFAGWYRQISQRTDQVDLCFLDEGSIKWRKQLFAQVVNLKQSDREAFFLKALKDPALAPAVATMGFNPDICEGFLSMAEGFIKETGKHAFPKEYTTSASLEQFFREAREMSKYVAEMGFFTQMVPEYFSLMHPNAQLDNAFYWRDENGQCQAGLLDFGSCMHMALPSALAGGWMGAEPDMLDEHERKLSDFFVQEFEKVTGEKLDSDLFYLHIKLAHAGVLYGCCANVRWCLTLIKKDEWPTVKDRKDKRIDEGFLLRCYFVQLQMFLGMWKKRSPYPYWQDFMKRTKMPRK